MIREIDVHIDHTYEYVTCKICQKQYSRLTSAHLNKHGITVQQYKETYNSPTQSMMSIKKSSISNKSAYDPKNNSMCIEYFRYKYSDLTEAEQDEKFRIHIENHVKKQNTNLQYYINQGFSEEEAKQKLYERQNQSSLDVLIKRYGEREGKRRYELRLQRHAESISKNNSLSKGYSNVSQKLFREIEEHRKGDYLYQENGGEYALDKYTIDFVDKGSMKMIEFFGDMFHGNPNLYSGSDLHPLRKIPYSEIWAKDEAKIAKIQSMGYEVLVIWESEYSDKNKTGLEKCLEFLKA